jgi:hypothetical protein
MFGLNNVLKALCDLTYLAQLVEPTYRNPGRF